MALLYINARCKQLLNILLEQKEYISINRIAAELRISRRTVYYDIEKVNFWLGQIGLQKLEVVRDKGLFLSQKQRTEIGRFLENDDTRQVYVFSPEERAKIIICYVIYTPEKVYMEQLTEYFEVSRNTIFTDLKEVSMLLAKYDLSLDYQPKKGYYIKGDTVRIRALFILYYNELFLLFERNVIKFPDKKEMAKNLEKLRLIERELGINYVEGVLNSIAAIIPLLYKHRREIEIKGLKEAEIIKTKEYAMVRKYFGDIHPAEQIYLSLHLLGSRVNLILDNFFVSESNTAVYDWTKELISEFEKIACVIFEKRDDLERALFHHLNSSLYRYRYGIQVGNVLADDVMNEYPDLFAITKIAVRKLQEAIELPIPDSEIAYLVLHFGAFLKIDDSKNEKLRILIVCANGIAAGYMIKREVQKLLPFAEIAGVVSSVDTVNMQKNCSLIISTVKLNTLIPSITVHPILTEFDKKTILSHRVVVPKNVEIQRDRLFAIVKKYVNPMDYDSLKQDIQEYFQGDLKESRSKIESECNLTNILDLSRVDICSEKIIWQSCIRKVGAILVEAGSIEKKYLETIINLLNYYEPYMFLTDDVVLAHAKPEDGVNCLDFSMAVFKQPIVFSKYKKARIVMILAVEDQEKHMHILQDILRLIEEPDRIELLVSANTKEELLFNVQNILSFDR